MVTTRFPQMNQNLSGKLDSLREQTLMVMGIDLSLTSTGMIAWDGKQVTGWCRKTTTPKLVNEARINAIKLAVSRGVVRYHPQLVVIEGHSFASRGNAKTQLSELHGVVKDALYESETIFHILSPMTVKAFAGHGKLSKKEMIEKAIKFWPKLRTIKGKKDDLADALHLARWAYNNFYDLVEEVD